MPAITAFGFYGATLVARAVWSLVGRLVHRFKQAAAALKNRREAFWLANLDERMLADIGLTRSDLLDAYAEPLWRDPTAVLTQRAMERRLAKRQAVAACVSALAFSSPFGAPAPVCCYQPTSRCAVHQN
jgi:uncharacterized protein YjiS (DUF1127 family)